MPIEFFKNWLFGQLPAYYKDEDTYKDIGNEGILERYLRNFGSELDEGIYPFVLNFLDLFDALKCREDLLNHLSFTLGLPPNLDNTAYVYRKVIKYAVDLYKIKGTKKSFVLLFNIAGLDLQIIEDAAQPNVTYDANPPYIYDNPVFPIQYDRLCADCGGYVLAYNGLNGIPSDPNILNIIQNIICYLQPINAKLSGLIRRIFIAEVLPITIGESTNLGPFIQPPGPFSDDFETNNSFA